MSKEKELILKMLEEGKINSKEALDLLNAVEEEQNTSDEFAKKLTKKVFDEDALGKFIEKNVNDAVKSATNTAKNFDFFDDVKSKMKSFFRRDIKTDIQEIDLELSTSDLSLKPTDEKEAFIKIASQKVLTDKDIDDIFFLSENNGILKLYQKKEKISVNHFFNPFGLTNHFSKNFIVEIYLPRNMSPESCKISLATGDINISDLSLNSFDLKATAGDVSIANSKFNDMDVISSAGDIEISNILVPDYIKLKSSAGDIDIDESETAVLMINSTAGDLMINDCSITEIVFSSVAGDARIINSCEKAVSVTGTTTAGNIKLETGMLERAVDLTLRRNPHISGCSVDNKFKLKEDLRNEKQYFLDGKEPTLYINLKTSAGDIKVR